MSSKALLDDANFMQDLAGTMSQRAVATKWGCSVAFVCKHRNRLKDDRALNTVYEKDAAGNITIKKTADRVIPLSEWLEELVRDGHDPDDFNTSHGHSIWTQHTAAGTTKELYANRFSAVKRSPKDRGEPAWPVIQPSRKQYAIKRLTPTPRPTKFKTAVVGADTQIGFDMLEDGTMVPYHDVQAIDIFQQIVALENPEQTVIAGDIIDLTEQSRWSQEARFARSTQPSLDYAREFAAQTRANTAGRIIWVEGNHDKRMSAFMETNALASMGLRKAGYPDSWPVMSIPNLVGLDDFDVEYIDAYPAGQHWIADGLRVIHGTKANSSGSTAAQYANATPHISTIFGHTHRQEVQAKTTFDRAGKIRTMNVNPGCLCRVDGTVPSVHGARHLDGSKATYWEDWQQGVTIVRYREDGTFYVEQVQIDEGRAFHLGEELRSSR